MLTPREQLAELDALIQAHKANLSHTRQLLNNPELAERLVAENRNSIQVLIKRIAEIESVQLHGPEMIERTKTRIEELQRKRSHVANNEAIQKMLDLAKQINDMQGAEEFLNDDIDDEQDAPNAEDLEEIEDIVEEIEGHDSND